MKYLYAKLSTWGLQAHTVYWNIGMTHEPIHPTVHCSIDMTHRPMHYTVYWNIDMTHGPIHPTVYWNIDLTHWPIHPIVYWNIDMTHGPIHPIVYWNIDMTHGPIHGRCPIAVLISPISPSYLYELMPTGWAHSSTMVYYYLWAHISWIIENSLKPPLVGPYILV